MAGAGEKSHFSTRTLNVAEKAQRIFKGTALGKAVTGSSSPAYRQLEWKAQPQLNPDDYKWADEAPGDPKAGKLPRRWGNAAIIAAGSAGLSELMHGHLDRGERIQDAAVYQDDGIVRVGINPEGDHLFGGMRIDDEKAMAVAMRLGRAPLRATLGYWLPDQQELLVPQDVFLVNPSVSADSIGLQGPHEHVPLV